MKSFKKPVGIESHQWFKNGDHPEDNCEIFNAGNGPFQGEGKVVRYYRHPFVDTLLSCPKCGNIMNLHGWIDTEEEGFNVCPGDWIVTAGKDNYYPYGSVSLEDIPTSKAMVEA